MPTGRAGGVASTAGSGSGSVAPEPALPRRNLTLSSLVAMGRAGRMGEFFIQLDVSRWEARNHPPVAGVRVQ